MSGKTNKSIAVIPDSGSPDEIAVSPRTGDVYVVNWGAGPGAGRGDRVSVISGRTNKIVATIWDPYAPRGVAVSPVTGDVWVINESYVPENGGAPYPGTIWVLNGRTGNFIADIADPNIPGAVAVSPKTGDAFVANGYLNNQSVWVMSD
jgi:DNA-binding beta-propeller fold protein YncE